jgi:hypothetical protein
MNHEGMQDSLVLMDEKCIQAGAKLGRLMKLRSILTQIVDVLEEGLGFHGF